MDLLHLKSIGGAGQLSPCHRALHVGSCPGAYQATATLAADGTATAATFLVLEDLGWRLGWWRHWLVDL